MRKIISLGMVFLVRSFFIPSYRSTTVHPLFLVISRKEERMGIDSKAIGKRISTLRKTKGLTQAQLAEVLNIADNSLAKIEIGARTPSLDLLVDMVIFFEVKLDYIVFGNEILNQIMN
ncbi:MAG: helix-turn-helix domain-containing protein [Lachnospiraceae bacterium]|nr:helix-turn-helix domain-containing protein [Lachnospiraceae bacterium]